MRLSCEKEEKKREPTSLQHFFCITLPVVILLCIIVIQIICA